MTGLEIMLIMGLIGGVAQMGGAAHSAGQAKKLRDEAGDQPQYKIPASAQKIIDMYESMPKDGRQMPGFQEARRMIEASAARGSKQIADVSESSVGATTGLIANQERVGKETNALMQLAAQFQDMDRKSIESNKASAYARMAGYEDEQFRLNEYAPWERSQIRADQMQDAARQQFWGGLDSLASTGVNYAGMDYQMKALDKMYPGIPVQPPAESFYGPYQGNYVMPGESSYGPYIGGYRSQQKEGWNMNAPWG
jgi:hypothetical protein